MDRALDYLITVVGRSYAARHRSWYETPDTNLEITQTSRSGTIVTNGAGKRTGMYKYKAKKLYDRFYKHNIFKIVTQW